MYILILFSTTCHLFGGVLKAVTFAGDLGREFAVCRFTLVHDKFWITTVIAKKHLALLFLPILHFDQLYGRLGGCT